MLLSSLLKPLGISTEVEREITSITEDSREVSPGALFFAYKGFSSDGNLFVEDAVKKGAAAVITDSPETYRKYSKKLPVFLVKNPRRALALVSSAFYRHPERELTLIGITGTNGKTTTALLIHGALLNLGKKSAYIGTLGHSTGWDFTPTGLTTPSPTKLFKLLREFADRGVEFAVLEVSSHALELERVYGIEFDLSIFTNLTPEHLDFHKDIYSYFLSKEKLFFNSKKALVNCDDPFGRVLYGLKALFPGELYCYGKSGHFKVLSFEGGLLKIQSPYGTFTVPSSLKGEFNAYNLTAAFGALTLLGFPPAKVSKAFEGIKPPGRLEEVAPGVFVDYAHTPDALEKLLKAVSSFTEGRVITVFGCGGERDREKRAPMGRIAENLSHLVIITNDNPRGEEPERIISDILKGLKRPDRALVIPDRREAIFKALSLKGPEDSVVIAGKGHENYQIIGSKRLPFSDAEVVREFYERRRGS